MHCLRLLQKSQPSNFFPTTPLTVQKQKPAKVISIGQPKYIGHTLKQRCQTSILKIMNW